MKKIILFDPSQGTLNLGDSIIAESIQSEMKYLLSNNITIKYSTHTPLMHVVQTFRKSPISVEINKSDLKIICGTNIIKKNLLIFHPDWNINFFTSKFYKNSILLGVGLGDGSQIKSNIYTKLLYSRVLSKNYIHSARDLKTKQFLNSLGVSALNTGCPTTWSLTMKHCATIPSKKSNRIVFTLTDYMAHRKCDQSLINLLIKLYGEVYFWPQGTSDYEYLKSLENTNGIIVLGSSIDSYKKLLLSGDIDYVGTRLHAGIFAMKQRVRAIIMSVDNRAIEMGEHYNINIVGRESISMLESKIMSDFNTEIKIESEAIEKFKNQFMEL
jgi:polysaccharide pyruvyl transferase WcaK-like protein